MFNNVIKIAVFITYIILISEIEVRAQVNIQAKDVYKIKLIHMYKHLEFCNSIDTEDYFLQNADDCTTIYNKKHISKFIKILNSLDKSSLQIRDYRIMAMLYHYNGDTTKLFFTYFIDWGLLNYNNSQNMYKSNKKMIRFFDKHLYKHWSSPIPLLPEVKL